MQNVHIFVFFVSRSDFPYEFPDEALPMYTQIQARARPNKDRSLSTTHSENIAKGFWCVVCYVPKRNCRKFFAREFGRFFCLFVAVCLLLKVKRKSMYVTNQLI